MKLVIEGFADTERRELELEGGRSLLIGRDSTCDLVLESPYVSRQHAELLCEDQQFLLRPKPGINGTYVNSRLVREMEAQLLHSGDQIEFPGFTLRLTGRSLASGRPDNYLQLARDYSKIKSELHEALLDKVDLRSLTHQSAPDEVRRSKLQYALDNVLASNMPSLSEDLEDLIIVEALRIGLLDRLVLQREALDGNRASSYRGFWETDPSQDILERHVESCARELGVGDSTRSVSEQAAAISESLWDVYRRQRDTLSTRFRGSVVRGQLRRDLTDLIFGLGPLEDLVKLPGINEVMVVSKDRIFAEAGGRLEETGRAFPKDEDLEVVIQRIVGPIGRNVNRADPIVDARLADGSRVHIVIPPIALKGPSITIRRFPEDPFTAEDLVANGTMSRRALQFLQACTVGRKNMMISGGTGSGKTTLLNVLGSQIPAGERIVVIEDSAELQLRQPNLVNLEARKANVEGEGEISIRDLVRASLRMRPDRIVVGECRGKEALDMLQAMNTGHDGSLTTAHANTPREMISRLEVMVLEAGTALPVQAIQRQIAGALDLIVQIARQRDRKRRITHITEIVSYDLEREEIVLGDIFRLIERKGEVPELRFTGFLPTFIEVLLDRGDTRLEELFGDG